MKEKIDCLAEKKYTYVHKKGNIYTAAAYRNLKFFTLKLEKDTDSSIQFKKYVYRKFTCNLFFFSIYLPPRLFKDKLRRKAMDSDRAFTFGN